MKIKNTSAWLCQLWILVSVLNAVISVVNFTDGKLAFGVFFLILSVAFSFVGGLLLQKAIFVYNHNKACEFLEDIHEYLLEKEPFEEFEDGNK